MLVSVEPTFYPAPNGTPRPRAAGGFPLSAYFPGAEPLLSEENLTQIVKIKRRGEVSLDLAQLMWMPYPNAPRSAEFFPPNDRSELESRGIKVLALYLEMTNERADFTAIHEKFPWLKIMSKTNPVNHELPNGLNARTLMGEYK